MDIKTAYLNASTEENLYMLQPEGFEKLDPDVNPLVCKLNKNIYGLKPLEEIGSLFLKNIWKQ